MTTIASFVNRLKKLGISVALSGNFPWVYMDEVCGKKVDERFHSDYKFTVFFRAIRVGEKDRITDIPHIFKKIRELL